MNNEPSNKVFTIRGSRKAGPLTNGAVVTNIAYNVTVNVKGKHAVRTFLRVTPRTKTFPRIS